MTEIAILELELTAVADLIAKGDLNAVEITSAAIDAARTRGQDINVVVAIQEEWALEQATLLDRARMAGEPLGALHGVPLAHKDMFYVSGEICAGGSSIRRDFRPTYTATVMDKLQNAGAVSIGRLNMAEFALNPTGHNRHNGNCHNPWNLDYCPGGSSSGSGASVAARIVFGSLGSDTGGSIRVPASMCGITGIKPTQGRVSRYGVMPLAFSVDCIGPLARSARDCARLLTLIAGEDENDPTSARESVPNYEAGLSGDVCGLRIGYVPEAFGFQTDPELEQNVVTALEVLQGRGAKIVEVSVPNRNALITYAGLVQRSEMATIHARWMQAEPESYATHVSSRIYAGYGIPATAYIEALSRRGPLLQAFCNEVFGAADILALPSLTIPVPTLRAADMDNGGVEAEDLFGRVTENARLINYLGLPAISVPNGFDRNSMPTGIQLVGRPFAEATLLRAGHAYQQDTKWHTMKPAFAKAA